MLHADHPEKCVQYEEKDLQMAGTSCEPGKLYKSHKSHVRLTKVACCTGRNHLLLGLYPQYNPREMIRELRFIAELLFVFGEADGV